MSDEIFKQNNLIADRELFKSALRETSLEKGTPFISIGDTARDIAIVDNGYLRTYHLDENGDEITTEFIQPQSFCSSYYSFYSQQPSFECIEAITKCKLYLIDINSLRKLYATSFSINVFARTTLEKACIERDLRIKKIIHLPALEKYEWFLENYKPIYKVAQLKHIASFLGMKPETLSRIRRKVLS